MPAWILGHDPTKRIIASSYAQVLSIKHSLDCKFVMNSSWYKELFPNTILSKSHNQKSKFLTTQNGFRFASSVLGSITGEGGDLLIIDDPHKPMDINSPKKRSKVIDWYEQTLVTRLNNKNEGAIVLVMQRLHAEDLAGYLLQNNHNWEWLKIPVVTNKPLVFQCNHKNYHLGEGELLHKSRDSAEDIVRLEQEIGKANFAAQYLQEPLDDKGSLLKEEDISFYDALTDSFEYCIQSWDTAIKIGAQSDYSVCLSFGISNNRYYLVHAMREKLDYPALKQKLYSLNHKFTPKFILIEDKASGQQLIQDAKLEGFTNIVGIKPKLDKVTRFASVVPQFQSGKILLPKARAMDQLIIRELTTFPYSKNDDIVDAMSQFLNFMKERSAKPAPRISQF
jgi:predicted phage terminase large subunit-like protein